MLKLFILFASLVMIVFPPCWLCISLPKSTRVTLEETTTVTWRYNKRIQLLEYLKKVQKLFWKEKWLQCERKIESFAFYAICTRCKYSITKSYTEFEFGSIFIALSDALKTIYNSDKGWTYDIFGWIWLPWSCRSWSANRKSCSIFRNNRCHLLSFMSSINIFKRPPVLLSIFSNVSFRRHF